MVKRFYKITKAPKVFFNPNIEMRTVAYGENIRREVMAWQSYFFSEYRAENNNFVISKQRNIRGDEYAIGGSLYEKAQQKSSSRWGTLSIGGVNYEIAKGGFVMANGSQSDLNVGSEIKAWAIVSIPFNSVYINAFAVIGKPSGSNVMCLALYEINKNRPTPKMIASVELEHTMNLDSGLICFDRHIFIVHNSKLSYYYYNIDKERLEEVAIGTDGPNSDKSWCTGVSSSISIDRAGRVFWLAEDGIYGFPIGYPRNLIRIGLTAREIPLGIRTNAETLCIYTEDRNSHKKSISRCCMRSDGTYERVAE